MNPNTLKNMFKVADNDTLATALCKLLDYRIETPSILIRKGYDLLAALRVLAGAGDEWTPNKRLGFLGGWLVRWGLADCDQPDIPTSANFRLNAEGRRFLGERSTSIVEALPGWLVLVNGGRGEMHLDLRNPEHVALMSQLLAHGWHRPGDTCTPAVNILDDDTQELPKVGDE